MLTSTTERAGRIHFRTLGEGANPVLLVHGWMTSGRVWDRLLPRLGDRRVIVPDLSGCGAACAASGTNSLHDHVNDLAALCDTRGLDGVHLVGHSMGGQIAALLATRLPERFASLTLMNPVPVEGLPLPAELHAMFRDSGGKAEHLGRILDMACLTLDAEARAGLLDEALRISPEVVRDGFEAWTRGAENVDLSRATMPANVIATDDPFLPAELLNERYVARLPRARLHRLAGPGHYPQVEAPAETAALLQAILS